MFKNKTVLYHFIAILTVAIWGVTFISTKILLNNGLTSVEIFFYRFVLAYFCALFISHDKFRANTLKDEFLFFLCGLCGGSLYFIAENTALEKTMAANVSLIICTAPVITAVLARCFDKEPLPGNFFFGSIIALLGVALVVFNGSIVLKVSPLGDLLTLFAAIMWAFYCLLLKRLSQSYSTLFITRKVFYYGVVSLFVYFIFHPLNVNAELLSRPEVYLNLLFLGIFASMLCYLMWNAAVNVLGVSQTANYIYVVPLVTILTAAVFLDEPVTVASVVGAVGIIGGVYIAEKGSLKRRFLEKLKRGASLGRNSDI